MQNPPNVEDIVMKGYDPQVAAPVGGLFQAVYGQSQSFHCC